MGRKETREKEGNITRKNKGQGNGMKKEKEVRDRKGGWLGKQTDLGNKESTRKGKRLRGTDRDRGRASRRRERRTLRPRD